MVIRSWLRNLHLLIVQPFKCILFLTEKLTQKITLNLSIKKYKKNVKQTQRTKKKQETHQLKPSNYKLYLNLLPDTPTMAVIVFLI